MNVTRIPKGQRENGMKKKTDTHRYRETDRWQTGQREKERKRSTHRHGATFYQNKTVSTI